VGEQVRRSTFLQEPGVLLLRRWEVLPDKKAATRVGPQNGCKEQREGFAQGKALNQERHSIT